MRAGIARSAPARWLAALLALLTLAGAAAAAPADKALKEWAGGDTPPLAFPDLAGRPHDLAAYRGKVVVVNFWATWCEPCRDEMPSLNKLRAAMAGQPFEVLGVDLGDGEAGIKDFLKKVPVDFPILLDRDSDSMSKWKLRGLPATYIVGPDGRIRYWYMGQLDWASDPVVKKIRALLPKP